MKAFKITCVGMVICTFAVFAYNNFSSSGKKMSHIVSQIWYNFEGDEADFDLNFSAFGIKEKSAVKRYDYVPEGLGTSKEDSKQSLGIKAAFSRKGYNWIDIFPKADKAKGKFPGTVKSIDMWVWGGNFFYNLEIVIEDFRGYRYSLPMGDLQYFGWRNKNVQIPPSIPQDEPYAPRTKGLRFNKFRIYSTPGERVDRFHCFFDYFKIVTDAYKEQYDGWELEAKISEEILAGEKDGGAAPAPAQGQ